MERQSPGSEYVESEPNLEEFASKGDKNGRSVGLSLAVDTRKERRAVHLFQPKLSDREDWWRKYMSHAPSPSFYKPPPDFLELLLRKPSRYHHMTPARSDVIQSGSGGGLMPGAYQHKSFVDDLEKSLYSYSFKGTSRDVRGYIKLDPSIKADVYSYDPLQTTSQRKTKKKTETRFAFESVTSRFIDSVKTSQLGPTTYEVKRASDHPKGITSSFRSSYPRFPIKLSKTPAPGTYDRSFVNYRTFGTCPLKW